MNVINSIGFLYFRNTKLKILNHTEHLQVITFFALFALCSSSDVSQGQSSSNKQGQDGRSANLLHSFGSTLTKMATMNDPLLRSVNYYPDTAVVTGGLHVPATRTINVRSDGGVIHSYTSGGVSSLIAPTVHTAYSPAVNHVVRSYMPPTYKSVIYSPEIVVPEVVVPEVVFA